VAPSSFGKPASKLACQIRLWSTELVIAFGTTVYEATGNLAMVMKVIRHTDVRTSMRYQHPILDPVRKAIDQRNSRHKSRNSEVSVQ
jgi:hypothetical protein